MLSLAGIDGWAFFELDSALRQFRQADKVDRMCARAISHRPNLGKQYALAAYAKVAFIQSQLIDTGDHFFWCGRLSADTSVVQSKIR